MSRLSLLGVAAAAALTLGASAAQAQVVQAGILRCTVGAGGGYVVGSQKPVACTYRNPYGEVEVYDGTVSTLGIDVGYTSISKIRWAVIAPSGSLVRGGLQGNYGGLGLQATVAAGVGAQGLIGGFQNQITLQPFSISGQQGLNAQIGLSGMSLALRQTQVRRRR